MSHSAAVARDELLASATFRTFLLTVTYQAMAELHRGNRQRDLGRRESIDEESGSLPSDAGQLTDRGDSPSPGDAESPACRSPQRATKSSQRSVSLEGGMTLGPDDQAECGLRSASCLAQGLEVSAIEIAQSLGSAGLGAGEVGA